MCINNVYFIRPKCADETEINVGSMLRKRKRCISAPVALHHRYWSLHARNNAKEVYKFHDNTIVRRFNYRIPSINGKQVLGVDNLRVILTFNIAYDTASVSWSCIGNLSRKPDAENTESDGDEGAHDKGSSLLDQPLLQETVGRCRPEALCYEVILIIVRHPVTGLATPAMAIKSIHQKETDNKPRPYVHIEMVPEDVWIDLPADPDIGEPEQRRAMSLMAAPCSVELSAHKLKVVKEYREYYFYSRPTWDIEKQAHGDEQAVCHEPEVHLRIAERVRLTSVLSYQSGN
ncbi:FluG domain-containing protein [Colletotrichum orchidophilum]|uniref:FluG domain-containing protein n=1 Tax=Colletotrichum orchidophilum TaxID=1209926 RepID=A0A1G4BD71_9PEZI|nr:FluG domain-containing protein [Colletotrichum orchidophilum]OHE99331.1 FluG domain-containing protein [Colletotrichum orchidophilum]